MDENRWRVDEHYKTSRAFSEFFNFMFHFNLLDLYGKAQLGRNDVIAVCFIHPRSVYILQEGTQQCVFTKKAQI